MILTGRAKAIALDVLWIIFGSGFYALSVNFFTAPNQIAPGGVTGIATMLHHLSGFPIGITALLLNVPLFIWGTVENGIRFLLKTGAATVTVSVMIDVLSAIPYRYTGDTLLASVFGGLFGGLGLALIFCRGATTGGTDIIARNFHKHFPHVSMGSIILASDVVVIVLSAIVYGSIENALYAMIAIFINTKVIDTVTYGFARDNGKLMIVISSSPEKLINEIFRSVRRGITLIDAKGAYSKNDKGVLLIALRPTQVYRAKAVINAVEPSAFIIVTTANAISGEGFTPDVPA